MNSFNHSAVIAAMQNLDGWRFVLMWVWLMALTSLPVVGVWLWKRGRPPPKRPKATPHRRG